MRITMMRNYSEKQLLATKHRIFTLNFGHVNAKTTAAAYDDCDGYNSKP